MNSRVKEKLLLVLVVVFAASAATAANHVLKGTYIDTVNGTQVTIPAATLTAVGNPLTVSCPGTTGTCIIEADMWAQNAGGSTTGNDFLLCLYVDGTAVDPYCFGYAGVTPADGSVLMGSSSQSLSGVAAGSHTVQTYFWSRNGGCYVQYRHFTYRVYKP